MFEREDERERKRERMRENEEKGVEERRRGRRRRRRETTRTKTECAPHTIKNDSVVVTAGYVVSSVFGERGNQSGNGQIAAARALTTGSDGRNEMSVA